MRGWNTGLGVGPAAARALDAVKAVGASATQTAQANKKGSIFARPISSPLFAWTLHSLDVFMTSIGRLSDGNLSPGNPHVKARLL
jgi:hypothetical protein